MANVIDAGIAIGWIQARPRSLSRIERLFAASRSGRAPLTVSTVNLAEILKHTSREARATGVDVVVLLQAAGVRFHAPDEAVARRVAKLSTSLGDGFAAATAMELGARLHTTDAELVAQLKSVRVAVTLY